jgi:hypothetical protein
MARLTDLHLALSTRDEDNASSQDHVRLFAGTEEIGSFSDSPPERGKVGLLSMAIELDYEDFVDAQLFLGLTGQDAWAPRTAFLWGRIGQSGETRIVPIAQNFWDLPNSWISQDTNEGHDRWPMTSITEAGSNDPLRDLVVYTETSGNEDSGSGGPLELSVFGGTDGLPVLIYQTVLSKVGKQGPAEEGGKYIVRLPVVSGVDIRASRLSRAQIANRSDDAWRGKRIYLFGISGNGNMGRLLGKKGNFGWISQDPHDSGTTAYRAHLTASFSLD